MQQNSSQRGPPQLPGPAGAPWPNTPLGIAALSLDGARFDDPHAATLGVGGASSHGLSRSSSGAPPPGFGAPLASAQPQADAMGSDWLGGRGPAPGDAGHLRQLSPTALNPSTSPRGVVGGGGGSGSGSGDGFDWTDILKEINDTAGVPTALPAASSSAAALSSLSPFTAAVPPPVSGSQGHLPSLSGPGGFYAPQPQPQPQPGLSSPPSSQATGLVPLAALQVAGLQIEGARRDNAVLQGIAVQLAEAIKRGTAENRGLVAALAAAEARVAQEAASAAAALEASRAEAEAARAEARALKEERDAAAERAEKAVAGARAAREETKAAREEAASARAEGKAGRDAAATARAEAATARGELAKAQQEAAKGATALAAAQKTASAERDKAAALKAELARLSKQLDTVVAEAKGRDSDMAALRKSVQASQDAVVALKADLVKLVKDREGLRAELAARDDALLEAKRQAALHKEAETAAKAGMSGWKMKFIKIGQELARTRDTHERDRAMWEVVFASLRRNNPAGAAPRGAEEGRGAAGAGAGAGASNGGGAGQEKTTALLMDNIVALSADEASALLGGHSGGAKLSAQALEKLLLQQPRGAGRAGAAAAAAAAAGGDLDGAAPRAAGSLSASPTQDEGTAAAPGPAAAVRKQDAFRLTAKEAQALEAAFAAATAGEGSTAAAAASAASATPSVVLDLPNGASPVPGAGADSSSSPSSPSSAAAAAAAASAGNVATTGSGSPAAASAAAASAPERLADVLSRIQSLPPEAADKFRSALLQNRAKSFAAAGPRGSSSTSAVANADAALRRAADIAALEMSVQMQGIELGDDEIAFMLGEGGDGDEDGEDDGYGGGGGGGGVFVQDFVWDADHYTAVPAKAALKAPVPAKAHAQPLALVKADAGAGAGTAAADAGTLAVRGGSTTGGSAAGGSAAPAASNGATGAAATGDAYFDDPLRLPFHSVAYLQADDDSCLKRLQGIVKMGCPVDRERDLKTLLYCVASGKVRCVSFLIDQGVRFEDTEAPLRVAALAVRYAVESWTNIDSKKAKEEVGWREKQGLLLLQKGCALIGTGPAADRERARLLKDTARDRNFDSVYRYDPERLKYADSDLLAAVPAILGIRDYAADHRAVATAAASTTAAAGTLVVAGPADGSAGAAAAAAAAALAPPLGSRWTTWKVAAKQKVVDHVWAAWRAEWEKVSSTTWKVEWEKHQAGPGAGAGAAGTGRE